MKKQAFTLAETLITLTILGIIAMITISSLIRAQTEKTTVTKVLKMYSTLNDIWMHAALENDGNIVNLFNDANNTKEAAIKFFNYFKSIEICNKLDGCYTNVVKILHDNSNNSHAMSKSVSNSDIFAKLPDGSGFIFKEWSKTCTGENYTFDNNTRNGCFKFEFDTNGIKEPNTLGIDIFEYVITTTGIKSTDTNSRCNWNYIVFNGRGCADWILKYKNMNYLHDSKKGFK